MDTGVSMANSKNRNYCFRKIVRRIMKEEHLTVPTKRNEKIQLIIR